MIKFDIINDNNEWNNQIISNDNFSPYQLFEWGEYKKEFGWSVLRLRINNDGSICYVQILYKKKFFVFAGFVVGSISGDISVFNKNNLIKFLKDSYNFKFIYLRTSFTNILDFNESFNLYNGGWIKSKKKNNSDYTIYIDLDKKIDELIKNCSSNWRKNLIRGQKYNLDYSLKYLIDYNDIDVHKISMLFERFKKIKDIKLPKSRDLKFFKKYLGNNIIVATSSKNQEFIGLRAFIFLNNKAIDLWAVTDEEGRRNYTSYFLLFQLFNNAKEMGIKFYDMSGIDPIKNENVFLFKNGLRSNIVEKLGEWEISNSKILSFLINKLYI